MSLKRNLNEIPSEQTETEVGFLLANVNEEKSNSSHVYYDSSSTTKQNNIRNPFIETNISNEDSSSRTWREIYASNQSGSVLQLQGSWKFFCGGLLAMVVTIGFLLLLSSFASFTAFLVAWTLIWFFLCFGSLFCAYKEPNGFHICNGITVALIFGIIACSSFSIFSSIDSRPLYRDIPVDSPELYSDKSSAETEGAIIYFEGGGIVDTSRIGQSYITPSECKTTSCDKIYYCVAPIIDPTHFNSSTTPVYFWAACYVDRPGENCYSKYFNKTPCFANWPQPYNAAVVLSAKETKPFMKSIEEAVAMYNLNSTMTKESITVTWVEDPLEEAALFWVLGISSLVASPVVYAMFGFGCLMFCGRMKKRADYSTIQ